MANEWTYWISEQKGSSIFAMVSQHSPCVSFKAGQVQSERGSAQDESPVKFAVRWAALVGELPSCCWYRLLAAELPAGSCQHLSHAEGCAGAGVAADAGSSVRGVRDGRDGDGSTTCIPSTQELLFLLQTTSTLQWSKAVLLLLQLTKLLLLFFKPYICLPQAITPSVFQTALNSPK